MEPRLIEDILAVVWIIISLVGLMSAALFYGDTLAVEYHRQRAGVDGEMERLSFAHRRVGLVRLGTQLIFMTFGILQLLNHLPVLFPESLSGQVGGLNDEHLTALHWLALVVGLWLIQLSQVYLSFQEFRDRRVVEEQEVEVRPRRPVEPQSP